MIDLRQGDCLEVMRTLPDDSVHACVTDPPYGLAFMGKKWDYDVPTEEVWREVLRVLKPGGFLLSFSGTRTYHRMVVRIEDAGFEIRDMIQWLYGSGFPKSHNVSKAIDKEAGAEREVLRARSYEMTDGGGYSGNLNTSKPRSESAEITAPATEDAKKWDGWGSALKPANEPICVARKPLIGTIAQNVLAHGCGGLNIDGCRIGLNGESQPRGSGNPAVSTAAYGDFAGIESSVTPLGGRWPANVVHDGSDEATRGMGESSRYFYAAKASKRERNEGVDGANHHPTVKPVELMRWLVRLVCPPGGVVLDPFMGSGTTGVACRLEGFEFVGIDRDASYVALARQRIAGAV